MKHAIASVILACLVFSAQLFASAPANEIQAGELRAVENCINPNQWFQPVAGTTIENPQRYIKQISNHGVVLLGEHHDHAEHHLWQYQTIVGLYANNQKMVLGFEMFPRSRQEVLDRWVAGQLTDKQFLQQVEWEKNWNFNPAHYFPLFHFARMNGIKMLALNVDRELVKKVSEEGWNKVAETDRQGVKDPAPMSDDYMKFMESVYREHLSKKEKKALKGKKLRKNKNFRRFVQGQQLWDAAMAQKLSEGVDKQTNTLVVGVMGSGHMARGFGVPEQLAALGIKQVTTLVPWHDQFPCSELSHKFADVVVGVNRSAGEARAHSRPLLGIYMEKHDLGVKVKKVMDDSVAEKSGLQSNDILIEMAGRPVKKLAQVSTIVKSMAWGTWLPIKIQRDDKTIEVIAKFPIAPAIPKHSKHSHNHKPEK